MKRYRDASGRFQSAANHARAVAMRAYWREQRAAAARRSEAARKGWETRRAAAAAPKGKRRARARLPEPGAAPAPVKQPKTLDEYIEMYEEFDEYEDYGEVDGGADY